MEKQNKQLEEAIKQLREQGISTVGSVFKLVMLDESNTNSKTGWEQVVYIAKEKEDCRTLYPLNGGEQ